MSRPFSYNDENFTVIDNLLFVHFFDSTGPKPHEPLIPIPDEIYKRMVTYNNIGVASRKDKKSNSYTVGINVVDKDNIPYIAIDNDRTSVANIEFCYYTFYLLKDI